MPTLTLEALDTHHLRPLDLTVAAGECVAIRGPSGSGKSRLLRALADLDPSGGTVRLDETPREAIPAPQWRRQVALMGAESQWWHERVGDHFADADERLLARLGFEPSVMEWEIPRLSSGEKQRLALARLLTNRPRALLLDEPTANLDAENSQRVETLVADYRREHQAPTLWIGHDPAQLARVAERRFQIEAGRLVEEA